MTCADCHFGSRYSFSSGTPPWNGPSLGRSRKSPESVARPKSGASRRCPRHPQIPCGTCLERAMIAELPTASRDTQLDFTIPAKDAAVLAKRGNHAIAPGKVNVDRCAVRPHIRECRCRGRACHAGRIPAAHGSDQAAVRRGQVGGNPVAIEPVGGGKQAAAEGKPLLLWEMDGHPLGCV